MLCVPVLGAMVAKMFKFVCFAFFFLNYWSWGPRSPQKTSLPLSFALFFNPSVSLCLFHDNLMLLLMLFSMNPNVKKKTKKKQCTFGMALGALFFFCCFFFEDVFILGNCSFENFGPSNQISDFASVIVWLFVGLCWHYSFSGNPLMSM